MTFTKVNGATQLNLPAMGGFFTYSVYPQQHLTLEKTKEYLIDAHDEVLRIEKKFTEFAPSIITTINQAGINPVNLDEESYSLIQRSIEFSLLSHGIFDISYATFGQKWRKAVQHGESIPLLEKEKLLSFVNFKNIKLNKEKNTIQLADENMKISLGGIGKGYAVDQAFLQLKKKGISNFAVNGSGDMRVDSHPSAPRPWKVGIRNPFSKDPNQAAGLVQITQGSVSTSGSYVQRNHNDPTGRDHHILRKKDHSSESILVSATVTADTCIESDVWATICLATSTENALTLMKENDLYAILIDESGKSHLSPRALRSFNK